MTQAPKAGVIAAENRDANHMISASYQKLRICFVCHEYPPALHGGIGTLIQMLSRALVAEGHEARVIGIKQKRSTTAEYEEDHGVKVWRLRASPWRAGWISARYRVYRMISQWCHNQEIDLVEVADFGGPAAFWPKLPVPVVARAHGSATFFASELNRTVKRNDFRLELASLRRADHVCSISHYAAKRTRDLFGLVANPVEVLPSFIDMPETPPQEQRCRDTVVFTGTLTPKKGVEPLIDAWRQVVAARPTAKLHLYGKDGHTPEGGSMKERLISRLDPALRSSIEFKGHVSREQLATALSRARLGVFPSYSETFGLAPAESMAFACPTIYSRCGCGAELIRDGVDGLLVDPGDATQIADAIGKILADDELAERLGKAGHVRIRNAFSLRSLVPRNIEFYRQCLHH